MSTCLLPPHSKGQIEDHTIPHQVHITLSVRMALRARKSRKEEVGASRREF
jgi:hypothetical protein